MDSLTDLTWAVVDSKGEPVTTLDGLADVMGVEQKDAATLLLDSGFADCAPAALVDEAREVKAQMPPAIAAGSYVSWKGGRGRVDLIVTNGTVPGLPAAADDVEGTADSPAARVVVYAETGGSWRATGGKVAAKVATLKRIPPLKGAAGTKTIADDIADVRVDVGVDVPADVLTVVYDRGVKAWAGVDATGVTQREWALGRVRAFCTKALGVAMPSYTRDDDLLPGAVESKTTPAPEQPSPAGADSPTGDVQPPPGPPGQPIPDEPKDPVEGKALPDGRVVLSAADVAAQIAALDE